MNNTNLSHHLKIDGNGNTSLHNFIINNEHDNYIHLIELLQNDMYLFYELLNIKNKNGVSPLDLMFDNYETAFYFDIFNTNSSFIEMQIILELIFKSIHRYYPYQNNNILYGNLERQAILKKCIGNDRKTNKCKEFSNSNKRRNSVIKNNNEIAEFLYKIFEQINSFIGKEKDILYKIVMDGLLKQTPYSLMHLIFNQNEKFINEEQQYLYIYILENIDKNYDLLKMFTQQDKAGNTLLHILLYSDIRINSNMLICKILKDNDLLNYVAIIKNKLDLNIFGIIIMQLKIINASNNNIKKFVFNEYYNGLNRGVIDELNILEMMFKQNFVSYDIFINIPQINLINFLKNTNINTIFMDYLKNIKDNEILLDNITKVIQYFISKHNYIYYLFLRNIIFSNLDKSDKTNIFHILVIINDKQINTLLAELIENIIEDDLLRNIIIDMYHDHKNRNGQTVNEILKQNKNVCLRRIIKHLCGSPSKNNIVIKSNSKSNINCDTEKFKQKSILSSLVYQTYRASMKIPGTTYKSILHKLWKEHLKPQNYQNNQSKPVSLLQESQKINKQLPKVHQQTLLGRLTNPFGK